MEWIAAKVSTDACRSDTYPNHSVWENHVYGRADSSSTFSATARDDSTGEFIALAEEATVFTKTQLLWDNWGSICKWTSDADVMHISGHNKFVYRESEIDKLHMTRIRERLQVSPAHMREYKPHTDYGAKALTILVPIAPGVSEPTRFHGYQAGATVRSLPWELNKAYMFRPTLDHSFHSYIGGEADRFVLNINFLF
jgi:hypothetical protein